MDIATVLRKLEAVQSALAQQQQHVRALELHVKGLATAATAQAAETVDAPAAGPITSSSVTAEQLESLNKQLTAVRLAERFVVQEQGRRQETVPPSEAGAGHLSAISVLSEADERAAYLRGFEAAKALLLAVKPEPERGPDNFLWVNVYRHCVEGGFILSRGYETKADAYWHSVPSAYKHCGLIRVWFNEGQYDD